VGYDCGLLMGKEKRGEEKRKARSMSNHKNAAEALLSGGSCVSPTFASWTRDGREGERGEHLKSFYSVCRPTRA